MTTPRTGWRLSVTDSGGGDCDRCGCQSSVYVGFIHGRGDRFRMVHVGYRCAECLAKETSIEESA